MMNIKKLRIVNSLWELTSSIQPVANARIAAAVIHKNQIVGVGINQRKSHPLQKKYAKNEDAIFLHAEINAIRNAVHVLTLDDFKKSDIIIVRRKFQKIKNGYDYPVFGLAKPCIGCMEAIKDFGIRNIYHSCDEDELKCRLIQCQKVD